MSRPRPKRIAVAGAVVASAMLVGAAELDLSQRKPWQVTGELKGFWRVLSLTPPGALLYFSSGRRRA